MVVEDPFVTSFLGILLANNGFRVVPLAAKHGLDLFRTGAVLVDLLITNTPALFAEIDDRIPLLYLSTCPDPDQISASRCGLTLGKPFQPRQLLDAVATLLKPPLPPLRKRAPAVR